MAIIKCCLLMSLFVGPSVAVPSMARKDVINNERCGYDSCTDHEAGVLNVHIVPHTHDDVGWLKTVDQYYYGSKPNIQKAGVQYILDSVVKELWEDPKRRFIYVETAFFWKWWVRQSIEIQDKVHILVREGRLQFVGGAWSMNDEAAAHYHSIVDQFTHGLKRLNATFGHCGVPTVGWQIDPFGHSREFASLLASMGYDGLFLGRIDYQDKKNREDHKTMEMIWRGDDDLGSTSDIFTSVLYNNYSPPPGFCYDVLCNDEPIIDDPNSPDFNVVERVSTFMEICKNISKVYATNNILITMGEDFQYQDASMWYRNLDKLINYTIKVSQFLRYVEEARKGYVSNNLLITMGGDFTYQDAAMWYKNLDKLIVYTNLKSGKDGLGIKLFYSTPNCYLKAVRDANPILSTKQDDFFPYASEPTNYWTGYFTSRPTTKYLERQTNTYLQMIKQLQVLTNLERHYNFVVDKLRAAMGVMQHHDAITGTEKQHVARDYVRIVSEAVQDASIVQNQAYSKLMSPRLDVRHENLNFIRCALNETTCSVSQNCMNFIVNIYNSVAWSRKHVVRIPVNQDETAITYTVTDPSGSILRSFVKPLFEGFKRVFNQSQPADYELLFLAELPPLGYINYYVTKTQKHNIYERSLDSKLEDYYDRLIHKIDEYEAVINKDDDKKGYLHSDDKKMIGDDPMVIQRYDDENEVTQKSLMSQVQDDTSKDKYSVKHTVKYYPASIPHGIKRASGAYIFKPNAQEAKAMKVVSKTISENLFGKEYTTILANNVSYIVRINNDDVVPYHEIEFMIGPINVSDGVGKEFVIQHEVQINNNGRFHTDSNGRQMIERIINHRPQWNLTVDEPISGNYYPVVNKISIEDDQVKLIVLTDRSVGGTSLKKGQIEIMVHRRLLHDDYLGVGEALNETLKGNGLIVRGVHKFVITEAKARTIEEADQIRKLELSAQYEPIVTFADAADLTLNEWKMKQNIYTGLKRLPHGVHILTLEQWDDGNLLLLRLENIYSTNIGLPPNQLSVDVNLNDIFKDIAIKSIQETLLAADRIDIHENWFWKTTAGIEWRQDRVISVDSADAVINLAPKQIKTFIIEYDAHNVKKNIY